MPERAKQVGKLSQRVIELLGLTLSEGRSILLGESNIAHMVSRHPEDYALYGEYIPLILSMPDYVALNTKDESIEYVKEVQMDDVYVKVAVRVSERGQLFARSVYRLNTNRAKNFIEKGTLKKY
ncbi:PBECR2 nuclease fold domain-containing protein [Faecalibacterium prausnitzii]|uniref:PBECR3 domain-containing polyvalent protein n=1 Tax=Faecalibacterium prausnitzii TaxID=853 RepID=UPI002905FDAA|nr:PBECR2 nuclease fold domain-containing protein [Faecalibacterium prausnitzii]MDU8667675.1 PBECR2 nuclease fold domain-containing protein [Faecalibacterium prausnitzii]